MYQRILALLLCIILAASLFGTCFASADSAMASSSQAEILKRNVSQWNCDSTGTPYSYAVTDLDGNGYLEVFAAITQGTGNFTSGRMFEITSAGSLVERKFPVQEGGSIPEVIMKTADVYEDPANGRKYYIFTDATSVGYAENYEDTWALSLYKGCISLEHICGKKYTAASNGAANETVYGADYSVITAAEYQNAVADYFKGFTRYSASFGWFHFLDGDYGELVTGSCNAFSSVSASSSSGITVSLPGNSTGISGTPAYGSGTYVPATQAPIIYESVEAAKAASQPLTDIPIGANGGIVITKNPTAESLAIGGKNWFIAHASGASKVEWQLIDTGNRVYSVDEAMRANPGLHIEVQNNDTLEISNVPASLNGWSARAVFSNGTVSAATQPAAIYVGDFVGLYGSVINAYKAAYQNSSAAPYEQLMSLGVSEYAAYSQHVGYGMKDLNKDGTPELIIAGTGANNNSDGVIYEICTLQNKVPVRLCISRARDRFYLREDSSILEVGSGGAACTSYSIFKLKNGQLNELEQVRSDLSGANQPVWYLSTNGGTESSISASSAQSKIDAYEKTIFMPFLTQIA